MCEKLTRVLNRITYLSTVVPKASYSATSQTNKIHM